MVQIKNLKLIGTFNVTTFKFNPKKVCHRKIYTGEGGEDGVLHGQGAKQLVYVTFDYESYKLLNNQVS